MKLEDALNNIHAPKGITTVVAAILSGDLNSVQEQKAIGISLTQAKDNLEKSKKAQRECHSDWAYWGYMGDIAYWSTVVNLLKAAELVGADNLPDIPIPSLTDGVIMDIQAQLMRWGERMYLAACKSIE